MAPPPTTINIGVVPDFAPVADILERVAAQLRGNSAPPLSPDDLKDLIADRERYMRHSIILNSIAWRIAEALGKVTANDACRDGDVEADLTELLSMLPPTTTRSSHPYWWTFDVRDITHVDRCLDAIEREHPTVLTDRARSKERAAEEAAATAEACTPADSCSEPTLAETDTRLVDTLRHLCDEYGGVVSAALEQIIAQPATVDADVYDDGIALLRPAMFIHVVPAGVPMVGIPHVADGTWSETLSEPAKDIDGETLRQLREDHRLHAAQHTALNEMRRTADEWANRLEEERWELRKRTKDLFGEHTPGAL